jgi:hypothetical protein
VIVIVIANTGLVCSEFVGIGAAVELLGLNRFIAVPLAAATLWYLVVFGSYQSVEKIFIVMTLVFFAYPVAAVMGGPDWSAVARGAFVPTLHRDPEYIFLLVGLIGTTITPYMQLYQRLDRGRGSARRHTGPSAWTYLWRRFSNLMSIFMIMATAATLRRAGHLHIETAADAAKALPEPVAEGPQGSSSRWDSSAPRCSRRSTARHAHALEVLGFPKSVNLDFRRAGTFFRSLHAPDRRRRGLGFGAWPAGHPVARWRAGPERSAPAHRCCSS